MKNSIVNRADLLNDGNEMKNLAMACVKKLYILQWDITSPRLYQDAMDSIDDVAARIWLELYSAEAEERDEKTGITAMRAARAWVRETRSNGVSYNETTEDADGNTTEKWNQQPSHNCTEAEAIARADMETLAKQAEQATKGRVKAAEAREFYQRRYWGQNRAAAFRAAAPNANKADQVTLQNLLDDYILS